LADISKIKVGGVEYDVKDVTARDGLDDKVDKVTGKGLSTEDYTTAEKNKLAGIDENANNYTHPSTHSASIIDEDSTHRFVTDEEINTWNSKASTDVATTEANGLMSSEDKAMLEEHEQQISQLADLSTMSFKATDVDNSTQYAFGLQIKDGKTQLMYEEVV
jgi:hypothetical protein